MAADINRVVLVGASPATPIAPHGRGDAVATIRLAFSSRAREGDGWADRSNYIDITLFGSRAELAGRHLAKGRRVGVDGRLNWSEWETADGGRRQGVEVVAGDIFFLDAPREAGDAVAAVMSRAAPPVALRPAAPSPSSGEGPRPRLNRRQSMAGLDRHGEHGRQHAVSCSRWCSRRTAASASAVGGEDVGLTLDNSPADPMRRCRPHPAGTRRRTVTVCRSSARSRLAMVKRPAVGRLGPHGSTPAAGRL